MTFELRRGPMFELSGDAARRGLRWNPGNDTRQA
jgi:hypothetical protein